jgi:hypothetical protein
MACWDNLTSRDDVEDRRSQTAVISGGLADGYESGNPSRCNIF